MRRLQSSTTKAVLMKHWNLSLPLSLSLTWTKQKSPQHVLRLIHRDAPCDFRASPDHGCCISFSCEQNQVRSNFWGQLNDAVLVRFNQRPGDPNTRGFRSSIEPCQYHVLLLRSSHLLQLRSLLHVRLRTCVDLPCLDALTSVWYVAWKFSLLKEGSWKIFKLCNGMCAGVCQFWRIENSKWNVVQ
jgi:hypothetical protein